MKVIMASDCKTYVLVALMWNKNSGEYPISEIYQGNQKAGTTIRLYYVAENMAPRASYKLEFKADVKSIGSVEAKTTKKDKVFNILYFGAWPTAKLGTSRRFRA